MSKPQDRIKKFGHKLMDEIRLKHISWQDIWPTYYARFFVSWNVSCSKINVFTLPYKLLRFWGYIQSKLEILALYIWHWLFSQQHPLSIKPWLTFFFSGVDAESHFHNQRDILEAVIQQGVEKLGEIDWKPIEDRFPSYTRGCLTGIMINSLKNQKGTSNHLKWQSSLEIRKKQRYKNSRHSIRYEKDMAQLEEAYNWAKATFESKNELKISIDREDESLLWPFFVGWWPSRWVSIMKGCSWVNHPFMMASSFVGRANERTNDLSL